MSLKKLFRTIAARILRALGLGPARIFYISGGDVLPPPLSKEDEEERRTRHGVRRRAAQSGPS
jgi:hypothetical protein